MLQKAEGYWTESEELIKLTTFRSSEMNWPTFKQQALTLT